MTAIVAALIPMIPSLIQGGIGLINSIRTAAQQTNEWTDAAEAAYQQALNAANNAPESRTDTDAGQ